MDEETTLNAVLTELHRATAIYTSFQSAHEGYAILLEEVDELWETIKMKQSIPERNRLMYEEAIQVAAMAIRLCLDCVK